MSGYVEKYNDLLVDFNHLNIDNEKTKNKLNKAKNDYDARLNELHENRIEVAKTESAAKADKKL